MNKTIYKEIRSQLDFNFKSLRFIQQITIDVLFLVGIAYLLQTPYQWLAFVPIAFFMFRQFSFLHEAVHNLAHPSARTNFYLGVISGGFCLTPYLLWKAAHMKHHYWTGNLEQDPTFVILKNHKNFSERKKKFIEFCWSHKIPLLGFLQHIGFWNYFLKDLKANKKSYDHWANLLIPTLIWSTIFWQASLSQIAVIAAGITFYMLISEDMIVPQHVGLHSDSDPHMHLHPWEQIEITRSWSMLWPIEQFVGLNMNYHTEHHLFPDLPWHELKKAHQLLIENKSVALNMVDTDWMSDRRLLDFAEVIRPVAMKRRDDAA